MSKKRVQLSFGDENFNFSKFGAKFAKKNSKISRGAASSSRKAGFQKYIYQSTFIGSSCRRWYLYRFPFYKLLFHSLFKVEFDIDHFVLGEHRER